MNKDLDKLLNAPKVIAGNSNEKENKDNKDSKDDEGKFFKMDDGFRSLQGILEESITIDEIKRERLGL